MARYRQAAIALTGLLLSGCMMPGQPLSPDDLDSGIITFEQITPFGEMPVPESVASNKPKVRGPELSTETSPDKLTQISKLSPEKRAIILTPNAGLINFNQEKYDNLKGKQEMALFFYADWCDACRVVESELAKGKGLLPGGIVLYKVNFDEQKDLIEAYEAKIGQVIVLNKQGEIFSRYAGTNFDSLIFQLRKVME